MGEQIVDTDYGFKKLQIADTVAFAIENIPSIDERTLEKFLQLIQTTGTFGVMTPEQIANKMRLTLKYIPDACPHSLLVIAELLELKKLSLPNIPSANLPEYLNGIEVTSTRLAHRQPARLSSQ
jgi:hypothetical protein